MNKSNNMLRAVVIMTILIGGTNSFSISARRQDSSIQGNCKGALRIGLIGGKGLVATYSAYHALLQSMGVIKILQDLVRHRLNTSLKIFEDLMYLGCVTCGLGMLAYTAGNSCLHDLE